MRNNYEYLKLNATQSRWQWWHYKQNNIGLINETTFDIVPSLQIHPTIQAKLLHQGWDGNTRAIACEGNTTNYF